MISIDITSKSDKAIDHYDWTMFFGLLETIVNGAVRIKGADLSKGARIDDISAPDKFVRTIREEFSDSDGKAVIIHAAYEEKSREPSEIILHPSDDPEFVIPHLRRHEPGYLA